MKGLSPKFPLEKGYLVGTYQLNTTFKDMIRQNFKNLLLTNQGERVMDINFGVGLRSYLFEPKTAGTMGNIAEKVHTQTKKYMPFIAINSVNFAGSEGDSNILGVQIDYTITPLQETDQVSIDSSVQAI
jgi:phage baseplate assembly protein W